MKWVRKKSKRKARRKTKAAQYPFVNKWVELGNSPGGLRSQFEGHFGVCIQRYFDALTGFDICKFDTEHLAPHALAGESSRETVARLHGQNGVDIILGLIDL